jgi:hypothetical protein
MQKDSKKHDTPTDANNVLGAVKYKFWLHNGELLYSCKTEEKKNNYERGLKSKNVKYTLEVVGS